ncbi:MAG: immune inhibitor A [Anaerolineae bacterium]|nr:immune inhibitor A [Anaerolineae bacterium]
MQVIQARYSDILQHFLRWTGLLLIGGLFVIQGMASDVDVPPIDIVRFPTVAALNASPPPTADRYDLAQRFFGVTDIPSAPTAPQNYQVGDRESFTITTTESGQAETFEAELRAIGVHVYIWLEVGVGAVADAQIIDFARRFDTEIYEQTRQLWGSEPIPGIDGDPRLHVLFSGRLRQNIGAFFMAQNNLPQALAPDSNEHEMMIFSLYAYGGQLNNNEYISASAHEFQHMINNTIDPDETDWMNEGFSMLTEHIMGLDNNSWAYSTFLITPQTQLNAWGVADFKSQEYGAAMLFMLYFYERYGLAGTQILSADTANGLQSVDNTLQILDGQDVENFFADWVLANGIRQPQSGYGYRTLPSDAAPTTISSITLPHISRDSLPQYASQYFRIENPAPSLTVDFTMSDTVPLLPVSTATGDSFWYGVRSNNSNPTLTHAFDLREVDSASLDYRIWYELELGWDYGYVSVSVDGGQTWQPQSTPLTTGQNPNGKAYGVGYSGESGGWLDESVNLDAFLGQEILVRFETVTDDATLRTGMAIDDIRLAAIDYHSDVNDDADGWIADGWIRTDNRLPQRTWIQVAQVADTGVTISRFLAQGADTFAVDVAPETTYVLVAISPFAPVTLQPTFYTVVIE